MGLLHAEKNYFAALMTASVQAQEGEEAAAQRTVRNAEFACVGAGIGGGFQNTKELRVMKYNEAIDSEDAEEWEDAVLEEHNKMIKYSVWTPVKLQDIPEGAKVISHASWEKLHTSIF